MAFACCPLVQKQAVLLIDVSKLPMKCDCICAVADWDSIQGPVLCASWYWLQAPGDSVLNHCVWMNDGFQCFTSRFPRTEAVTDLFADECLISPPTKKKIILILN